MQAWGEAVNQIPLAKSKPLFISTVLKEPCVRLVRRLRRQSTHTQRHAHSWTFTYTPAYTLNKYTRLHCEMDDFNFVKQEDHMQT